MGVMWFVIDSMSVYDTRPSRPNSIEIKRNYQGEVVDGMEHTMYGMVNIQQETHQQYGQANQYPGTETQNTLSHQMYEEAIYNSQTVYGGYAGNAMSPEGIYGPGTPTRNKIRPTQPPPAPPPNTGASSGSNGNTPTRGRSMSTGRDNLPPPPPVPDCILPIHNNISQQLSSGVLNGNMASKFLSKANTITRAGSPQRLLSSNVQDANAMVLAQLNNQLNNMNPNSAIHDLPPPPPAPDQVKISPANTAPPPPPPPPPFEGSSTPIQNVQVNIGKITSNGDANNQQSNGIIVNGTAHSIIKKNLPPLHDTRNDLMKAIRDGIKLRKVEKSDQNDNTRRIVPLNDVASILARRVAIELTDSEDSDSEDDSEVWMEANETSA